MHPSNRLCIKKKKKEKRTNDVNASPVSRAREAVLLFYSDLVKSESAEIL